MKEIKQTAELYDSSKHDRSIAEYVAETADITKHEIGRAWEMMDRYRCPLFHADNRVYDKISNAVDDFLMDNDIATDDNHYVDIEEIFNLVSDIINT